jgi:phosphatidate cytidylyltransferase
MDQPESSPDHEPTSLRAAHRARHAAAAPDAYENFDDDEPDDEPAPPSVEPPGPPRSRAGRNLPAAIGVGVVLGGTVLASLLLWKPAFYAVVIAAMAIGTWEMTRAVRTIEARAPLVPLLLGCPAMVLLGWYGGAAALPYGLLGTVVAVLVWRLADGPTGYQRDVVPALLIAVYVSFLAGFAVLLFNPDDGNLRVLAALVAVVLSDTGGYVAGVLFGRHQMAPSVSPAKSWEGFAGSLAAAAVGSAVLLYFMLDAAWWHGLIFGVAIAAAATFGDLAESLIKRDLRIKDMSTLLPGHGGLMDRLDSILLAAPTAYLVLILLIPPG